MDRKCTLCGNIYKNRVFRGGYVCADCTELIKRLEIVPIVEEPNSVSYSQRKKPHITSSPE